MLQRVSNCTQWRPRKRGAAIVQVKSATHAHGERFILRIQISTASFSAAAAFYIYRCFARVAALDTPLRELPCRATLGWIRGHAYNELSIQQQPLCRLSIALLSRRHVRGYSGGPCSATNRHTVGALALPKMSSCKYTFTCSIRLRPLPFWIWDPSRLLSHTPPSAPGSDIASLSTWHILRKLCRMNLPQSTSGHRLLSAHWSLAVPARNFHTRIPRVLSASLKHIPYGTTLGILCRDKNSHLPTCKSVVPDHLKDFRNFISHGGYQSRAESRW